MIIDTRELHDLYNELKDKVDDNRPLSGDEQMDWDELQDLEQCLIDFWHGEIMVPENEFTAYARELAEDIGYTGCNADGQSWPYNHIDWESAANELRQDYMELEWRGQTYLARA